MADALDAFQKCTELNPEAVRAAKRKTKLKQLLDSGIHSSAPVTAEMIEPSLDHVSHTLPERRDDLPPIVNPEEVNAVDSQHGNRQKSRPARNATGSASGNRIYSPTPMRSAAIEWSRAIPGLYEYDKRFAY